MSIWAIGLFPAVFLLAAAATALGATRPSVDQPDECSGLADEPPAGTSSVMNPEP